ncbi:MAG: hypothetical protein JWR69_1742 [Pedosphaera sp.]|nr:hypothetical protein [Pedosphaera sp.]
MSDQSQTVEVLIKTVAELEGAKNAVASMERQIGSAKIAGKEYAALEAKVQKAKAVIAEFEKQQAAAAEATEKAAAALQAAEKEHAASTEAVEKNAAALQTLEQEQASANNETEQGSEKTKAFGEHAKEAKKTIQELGQAFPLASLALKAFVNPIGTALALAIGAFVKCKQVIEETNRALEEAGERAASPTFLAAIEAKKAALQAAAVQAALYEEATANLVNPEELYQRSLTTTINLLNERYAAQTKIADAEKGLKLEEIARDEALTGDHNGAIAKRITVEKQSRQDEIDRQKKHDAELLGTKEKAKQYEVDRLEALRKNLPAIEAKATAADADQARDLAQLNTAKGNQAGLEQLDKEALKKTEAYGGEDALRVVIRARRDGDKASQSDKDFAYRFKLTHLPVPTDDLEHILNEATAAKGAKEANAAEIKRLEERTNAKAGPAAVAKVQLDKAKADATDAATKILDLTTEIAELKQTQQIKLDAATTAAAAANKTDVARATGEMAGSDATKNTPKITPAGPHGLFTQEQIFQMLHPLAPTAPGFDFTKGYDFSSHFPTRDFPGPGGGTSPAELQRKIKDLEGQVAQMQTIQAAALANPNNTANMDLIIRMLAQDKTELERQKRALAEQAARRNNDRPY